jgi:hypothetical protein
VVVVKKWTRITFFCFLRKVRDTKFSSEEEEEEEEEL